MLQNDAETQPSDPNELLQRKVDNGSHDVAAHPAIPLRHFFSHMATEWRQWKPSILFQYNVLSFLCMRYNFVNKIFLVLVGKIYFVGRREEIDSLSLKCQNDKYYLPLVSFSFDLITILIQGSGIAQNYVG